MIGKLYNIDIKGTQSFVGLNKRATLAIQNHFRLTNYQMLVLSWIKGLWTGVLLSLILHYFIKHKTPLVSIVYYINYFVIL